MQDVSSFLDVLSEAAGGTSKMRELVGSEASREITASCVSMWKRRGLPWQLHAPMHRVCAKLGVAADPSIWRTPAKQVTA